MATTNTRRVSYQENTFPLPGTTLVRDLRYEGEVDQLLDLDGVCRLPGKHLRTFGACWTAGGYLLSTDLGRDVIWFWQPGGLPKAFRKPAGGPTLLKLDPQGRLHVLEHLCTSVSRTEPDGAVIVVFDLEKLGNNVDIADFAADSDGNLYLATRTETVAGFGSQKVGTIQRIANHKKVEDIGCQATLPIAIDWDTSRSCLWVLNGPDGSIWQLTRIPSESNGYTWQDRQLCALWSNNDIDAGGIAVRADGIIAAASLEGLYLVDSGGNQRGVLHLPEPAFRPSWGGPWSPNDLIVAAGCSVYLIPGK